MTYAFGVAYPVKDIKEAYTQHHSTCRLCKGSTIRIAEEYEGRPVRECNSCGYKFVPKEPTEDNLKAFGEFLGE